MRAAIDAETVFCLSAVLQAVEAASSRGVTMLWRQF
jgi:hypothetical protein